LLFSALFFFALRRYCGYYYRPYSWVTEGIFVVTSAGGYSFNFAGWVKLQSQLLPACVADRSLFCLFEKPASCRNFEGSGLGFRAWMYVAVLCGGDDHAFIFFLSPFCLPRYHF
jgi:hypothetical protein